MNDKEIREAMKQYIEKQADNILSEAEEKHDLSALDEKVYATIGANQDKHKTAIIHSFKKMGALVASFVLIIGLSITALFILNKEPAPAVQDVYYSITISYDNEQYGYYSNLSVIDKYNLKDIPDLNKTSDSYTGNLTEADIIQLDGGIEKERIIGAKIYPYSDKVIILTRGEEYYYFEKIATE